jgi:hypothetical protein
MQSPESWYEDRAQANDSCIGVMCLMMDHEECEDEECECFCHKHGEDDAE